MNKKDPNLDDCYVLVSSFWQKRYPCYIPFIEIRCPFHIPTLEHCTLFLSPLRDRVLRVWENLESTGILLWHFPGLESPGKRPLVLESSGNLLNSTKKIWRVWKAVRINIDILGVEGLIWILEPLKIQSESWKSPGNLFLKKGTNPGEYLASTEEMLS